MPKQPLIRRMSIDDLDRVMAIEEASFASPWSRASFENELRKEYGVPLVVEIKGHVVGYLIQWLVVDEIHIANIAVHPQWRRQGFAEMMIEHCLSSADGFHWAGLEVRDGNDAARRLYEKFGFREAGVRENYYKKENADAIVMIKELDS